MLPSSPTLRFFVSLGLVISTFGWGISFFFTFDAWDGAVAHLYWMGAEPIAYQPLLGYWLKMAGAVFGCLGIASALAFRNPQRYE